MQQAEPVLRDLAARYPNQFEVVETLGLIYAERGDLEQALPLLETACRANTSSAEAAANLGSAYVRLNRVPQAVVTLRRAVSLDAKNSQTQSTYGQALMMAKRPREAAQALADASALDPENADILYNWALAAFDSGDARQATLILARIRPDLRSAEVESLCGDAEENQQHFDRALICFQNAVKLQPSEPNLNALGLELLKHWSFEPAIKTYQYAITRYPSSSRLQAGLGIAFYANSQEEQAARVFSRLLVSAPNESSYAKLLGESCLALKAEFEPCNMLPTYTRRHPTDFVAATLAASAILEWHDSARYDLARQLLEKVIAKGPASADAYYRMGVLDQEQGKWTDSVAMLKRADALRPRWTKTHLRLAQAYFHLDQKQQAHREAELARQFRQSEDADAESKRAQLKTFVLESSSVAPAANPN